MHDTRLDLCHSLLFRGELCLCCNMLIAPFHPLTKKDSPLTTCWNSWIGWMASNSTSS
jgi:hypothetical protein